MGFLKNLFSKEKEPSYDSIRIGIKDLKTGFIFDYDLSSWEVLNTYKYDWGNHFYTLEYKISNGSQTLFLGVEEDDELLLTLGKKIKLSKIDKNLSTELINNQKPPQKIIYQDETFVLEEESPGYFLDTARKQSDWEELISWDLIGQNSQNILTIEQWAKNEFEGSLAKVVKEFEISNILPVK
ncbi:DUF4178 domain-containing protein [Mesonia aestuariivivens]|uniref:DUF4178 domain-containing protein n=1 Tax=Mesonia aestuariivivens TaxID=2796128 RepID=A0ABS6W2M5_9FLAO|nr:DUF4178 domain-containing protein [Mesonia aestuariivivens]MBW2961787.1 DUF4178 domain-containing protein [Mesonia aestuariivivens]